MIWIILAAALAVVTGYLWMGRKAAIANMGYIHEKAEAEWRLLKEYQKSSIRWQIVGMVLFWPFLYLADLVRNGLDDFAGRHDPKALAEQNRQLQARIAELERDLGLPRSAA